MGINRTETFLAYCGFLAVRDTGVLLHHSFSMSSQRLGKCTVMGANNFYNTAFYFFFISRLALEV